MTVRLRAVISTLLLALAAGAAAYQPPSFLARYEVQHSGARIAETTLSVALNPETGDYELRSVTEPRGLAALIRYGDVLEVSQFAADGERLIAHDYRFDDGTRKGRRNSTIQFDWDTATASSLYKGKAATLSLEGGETDRLLLQLAVMRDLALDRLPTAYAIVDRNERKLYEFSIVGEEALSTPAGQFDTVKVRRQRAGSSRATLIWAAREHGYLPVKMVQLKDERPNAVLTIISMNHLVEVPGT